MDSVSHGSGGIDPPPEYRSSYSRLPILLSPAPSKHQLQEYRSIRFCKYLRLQAFDRSSKGCAPVTSSRTAHPISMPSTMESTIERLVLSSLPFTGPKGSMASA
eukprot:scaffold2333_cov118-Isochrysis_galbana.AAC.2